MATPPDRYEWLRQGDSYTSPATTCTTSSSTTGATTTGTYWDEGTGDSNAWYFLSRSTECIAPGTMVQMAGPGQIIPVRSMDELQQPANAQEMMEAMNRMGEVSNRIGMHELQPGVPPSESDRQRAIRIQQQQHEREDPTYRYSFRLEDMPEPQPRSHVEAAQREAQAQAHEHLAEQQRRFAMLNYGEPMPVPQPSENLWLSDEQKKAEEKAQELLGMLIGEEDLATYKRTGKLYVKGKKHEYIIPKEGFIYQLKKDKVINLCVHLERKHAMPPTDNVIAMKLSIEGDEKRVLEMANKHGESERRGYRLPECAGMAA